MYITMFSVVSVCLVIHRERVLVTITHDVFYLAVQGPRQVPVPPNLWHLVTITGDLFKLVHFKTPYLSVLTSGGYLRRKRAVASHRIAYSFCKIVIFSSQWPNTAWDNKVYFLIAKTGVLLLVEVQNFSGWLIVSSDVSIAHLMILNEYSPNYIRNYLMFIKV